MFNPTNLPVGVYKINRKGARLGLAGLTHGTLVVPHTRAIEAGEGFLSSRGDKRGWAYPFGLFPLHHATKWRGLTFFADQVTRVSPVVKTRWDQVRRDDSVVILNDGRDYGLQHHLIVGSICRVVSVPSRSDGEFVVRGLCDWGPSSSTRRQEDAQYVKWPSLAWTPLPITPIPADQQSRPRRGLGRIRLAQAGPSSVLF